MDKDSGTFTVVESGTYHLTFSGVFHLSSWGPRYYSSSYVYLKVNEKTVATSNFEKNVDDTFYAPATIDVMYTLKPGDQVKVQFYDYQNSFLASNTDRWTHFTGRLVEYSALED